MPDFELHIITNCVQSVPSTVYVNTAYRSFCDAFGRVPAKVWCDPSPNKEHFLKYSENINAAGFGFARTNGLQDAYYRIITESKADFIFVLEHDWSFVRRNIKHSLGEIIETMSKDDLPYMRFNMVFNHVAGWDKFCEPVTGGAIDYCLTPCWSGSPHLLNRKKCLEMMVPEKILAKSNKTMERKLTLDGDLPGAIYGPLNHPEAITHLDARGNVSKPFWTPDQARRMFKQRKKEMIDHVAICFPCENESFGKGFSLGYDHYSFFANIYTGESGPKKALEEMPRCRVLFFVSPNIYITEEQLRIACGLAHAENRNVRAYSEAAFLDGENIEALAVPVDMWNRKAEPANTMFIEGPAYTFSDNNLKLRA